MEASYGCEAHGLRCVHSPSAMQATVAYTEVWNDADATEGESVEGCVVRWHTGAYYVYIVVPESRGFDWSTKNAPAPPWLTGPFDTLELAAATFFLTITE